MSNLTLPNVSIERNACKESDIRYTPASAVQALLSSSVAPPKGYYVEPAAGSGDLIRVLDEWGFRCSFACEIREEERRNLQHAALNVYIGDYLSLVPLVSGDTYIMNPPFSLGAQFWAHIMKYSPGYVAALLRCNTLGSNTWADTWNQYPPTAIRALRKRPSFTGDGKTDASEYMWAIYHEGDKPMNLRSV